MVQNFSQDAPSDSSTPFQEFNGDLQLKLHHRITEHQHHDKSTLISYMNSGDLHGQRIILPASCCLNANNLGDMMYRLILESSGSPGHSSQCQEPA